ncbi:MAG: hypothetical protein HY054_00200 [Proteobacteria bacterium]|nr:hypothetical protein [Pseudomonadota bacterium]
MRWRIKLGALALLAMLNACGLPSSNTTTAAPPETTTQTTAQASDAPQHVGDCVDTTVREIASRLEGMPNSGSAITYANGIYQVSYDMIDGVTHSRVGDPVHLCLISLPADCPAGDDRGKTYQATNARTHETWSAPDAEHMCGGA